MTDNVELSSSPDAPASKLNHAYCSSCGSDHIAKDAWALFNLETQDWELAATFDHTFCLECETEAGIDWRDDPLPRAERIARLNDLLRQRRGINGTWMITQGVQALGAELVRQAMESVGSFSEFSEDNDPQAERDFGSFKLEANRFFFKIDYYDLNLEFGSEDPTDPNQTKRVLTLMLAEEY